MDFKNIYFSYDKYAFSIDSRIEGSKDKSKVLNSDIPIMVA